MEISSSFLTDLFNFWFFNPVGHKFFHRSVNSGSPARSVRNNPQPVFHVDGSSFQSVLQTVLQTQFGFAWMVFASYDLAIK